MNLREMFTRVAEEGYKALDDDDFFEQTKALNPRQKELFKRVADEGFKALDDDDFMKSYRYETSALPERDKQFIYENGYDAWKEFNQANTDSDIVSARRESIDESVEGQIGKMIAPRVMENLAQTGEERDLDLEAGLDVASLPFRVGSAVAGTGAKMLGETLGLRDAPEEGYTQDFEESIGQTGGTSEQGGLESFAEDVVRDPLNVIPGLGTAKGLGRAIYKAPIIGKALKKVDAIPSIIANQSRQAKRVDSALRQTGKKNEQIRKGIVNEIRKGTGSADDLDRFVIKAQRDLTKSSEPTAMARAMSLGLKGAGEASLEGGRQAIEGDFDAGALALGSILPMAGEKVGKGAKSMAKKMLDSKLKFKPSKSNVTYKPDTGELLEQGLLSNRGMNATLGNVERRAQELGDLRSSQVSDESMRFYDAKDRLLDDLRQGNEIDLGAIQESGVNIDDFTRDAKIQVASLKAENLIDDVQAEKMLDVIDRERENLAKFTMLRDKDLEVDMGISPLSSFSKGTKRYWNKGKVNRNLGANPPTAEEVMANNIMWDTSRDYVNRGGGLGEVNTEFAKILPLKENLEDIQAKMNNANLFGLTALSQFERVAKSNPIINAVYGLRGAENLFRRSDRTLDPRELANVLQTTTAKESVRQEDEDE